MLIKLTLDEWQVLKEFLAEVNSETCLNSSENQPILQLTDDIADEYRNLLQDEFDVMGLDEKYEPTIRGRILESLIDKLFTG